MEAVASRSGSDFDAESGQREAAAPEVAVTLVALTVSADRLYALLRADANNGDSHWRLPRRLPRGGESLEEAARAEGRELLGIAPGYLEQLYTWGETEGSDLHSLRIGYLSLSEGLESPPAPLMVEGGRWWPLGELPPLPNEDGRILEYARKRLRSKLSYTNLAWSLLPQEFTLSDLQLVYEVVQGRPLDKRNFRKWVLANGLVEATAHERRDGAHRPARLYRFASREVRTLE